MSRIWAIYAIAVSCWPNMRDERLPDHIATLLLELMAIDRADG